MQFYLYQSSQLLSEEEPFPEMGIQEGTLGLRPEWGNYQNLGKNVPGRESKEKCLVVSEHVVMFKEQPAVVGGDEWARRSTVGREGSKGSGPDPGATGGHGKERGSCPKEDSQ